MSDDIHRWAGLPVDHTAAPEHGFARHGVELDVLLIMVRRCTFSAHHSHENDLRGTTKISPMPSEIIHLFVFYKGCSPHPVSGGGVALVVTLTKKSYRTVGHRYLVGVASSGT